MNKTLKAVSLVVPVLAAGLSVAACGSSGGTSSSPASSAGTTVTQTAALYQLGTQDNTSQGTLSPGTQVTQECAWSLTKVSNIVATLSFEEVTVTSGPLAGREGSVVTSSLAAPLATIPACSDE